MRIKSFWNYVGADITKLVKSVALLSAVLTGIMAEFVVPMIMLMWFGYKEIPFRIYMAFWVIAAITTVGVTLAFGLLASARYWRKVRLPYNKVVDEHDKFRSCPLCGGAIEQMVFGGLMPMVGNPRCRSCKTEYHLHQRFLLEDEFKLVQEG